MVAALWPTFFHKGLTIISADDDQVQIKCTGTVIYANVISSLQSGSDGF